jgi:hypothetical protein
MGFWSDVWDGVKSVGQAVAGPLNDVLKSTKAISRFAPMIPVIGNTVGSVANSLGYGRRKRRVAHKGGMKMRALDPYMVNPGFAPILPGSRVLLGGKKRRKTKGNGKKMMKGSGMHMSKSMVGSGYGTGLML